MIRVLIVDDSNVFSDILTKILQSDIDIKVIGRAVNGIEAVNFTERLKPDVITMDIQMPLMGGVEATDKIMRRHPTPIIVLSSYVNKKEMNVCFDALKAGAVDVMEKPTGTTLLDYQEIEDDLIKRVKIAAGVKVFSHFNLSKGSTDRGHEIPPYDSHRPSITLIMKAAAEVYGSGVLGVLLTGMGKDGAEGLKSIKSAGGRTIVQDEETSAVFGMPKEAIENNAADHVLPINRIAKQIMDMV